MRALIGMALLTESDADLLDSQKRMRGPTLALSPIYMAHVVSQMKRCAGWSGERAFTQRESNLLIIKIDTALVPLNGDPRFKALLGDLATASY